jgi:hypothetical protein
MLCAGQSANDLLEFVSLLKPIRLGDPQFPESYPKITRDLKILPEVQSDAVLCFPVGNSGHPAAEEASGPGFRRLEQLQAIRQLLGVCGIARHNGSGEIYPRLDN